MTFKNLRRHAQIILSPESTGQQFEAMKLFPILKNTVTCWLDDDAPTLGAALAYYTVFSLAPLLIISIAISGFVLGEEAASGQIFAQLRMILGDQSGKAIQDIVQSAGAKPEGGVIAAVAGLATLLFGASGVFGQLQTSLNLIWGVKGRPGRGVLRIVKDRFLSFSFILVVGFLLLVSLLLSTSITSVADWIGGVAPGTEIVAQALNFGLSLVIITALFALIFKVLPDASIAWKDVWFGAFLTSLLFTVGKYFLGLYLGTTGMSSAYGAAGSLIVLLLWVYYSAQIVFLGAEFTKVWSNPPHSGRHDNKPKRP